MWDNINLIINKKLPASYTEKLHVDDKCYQLSQSIANILNKYFCNIPSLASKLPKTKLIWNQLVLISLRKKSKFKFSRVSELEVYVYRKPKYYEILWVEKVRPFLVSVALFQIYCQLTYIIINLSISQGIFPDSMKIAKVVPIFKQGSRLSCDNYQPILILSTWSKTKKKAFSII